MKQNFPISPNNKLPQFCFKLHKFLICYSERLTFIIRTKFQRHGVYLTRTAGLIRLPYIILIQIAGYKNEQKLN